MKKVKNTVLILLLFCVGAIFPNHSIDVVIPCHKKDRRSLDIVIEGIKKNVNQIHRIIVVS